MDRKHRIFQTVGLILFLLIAFSCKTARDPVFQNVSKFQEEYPRFSSEFENQLKEIYQEKALFGDFIFAVVDGNGLAYSFAINREILKGEKSSLDNNSPIYIASGTKSFTGTLLKILEQKKVLDLNKSLNDYFLS